MPMPACWEYSAFPNPWESQYLTASGMRQYKITRHLRGGGDDDDGASQLRCRRMKTRMGWRGWVSRAAGTLPSPHPVLSKLGPACGQGYRLFKWANKLSVEKGSKTTEYFYILLRLVGFQSWMLVTRSDIGVSKLKLLFL